ncbi:MAG: glycosyltransferase [bacterium]|nr:glycosyltransferase [bacterium]
MDISVVIISYNSERFLKDNLQSLVGQSVKFKEIIVVDNHSSDNSLKIIESFEKSCPYLQKIALKENSGYTGGANTGINHSSAHLVMVANSDTILDTGFNRNVLNKFENDPELSLLSPLIFRFDKKTVDSAGQAFSRSLHPCEIGYNQNVENVNIKEKPVFSVCGAATVFRRTALETLKIDGDYYDEDFFIFWEDFDIGWRANLLGLKTLFYPEAVVYHFRSATLERGFISRFSLALARPAFIKYHLVKNRGLVLIKNFRFKQFFWNIPFIILKDLVWVGVLTFSSPKIIIQIMKSTSYFKKALRKRKLLKLKERENEIPIPANAHK